MPWDNIDTTFHATSVAIQHCSIARVGCLRGAAVASGLAAVGAVEVLSGLADGAADGRRVDGAGRRAKADVGTAVGMAIVSGEREVGS